MLIEKIKSSNRKNKLLVLFNRKIYSLSMNKVSSVIYLAFGLILLVGICYGSENGPTSQQEQELLLLEALGRRYSNNPVTSNYSPNSIMDILGKSKCFI